MLSKSILPILAGAAMAQSQAQGPAPAPSLLTSTQSGVLPIAPTPFPGVQTIEGAIVNDGNPLPGFIGPGGYAQIQNNNPQTSYVATLPTKMFDPYVGSTITGSITGAASSNGTGVMFTVNFSGLPSEMAYGPFVYHIHNLPISSDGNCTASLGHLDPTNRGELHACDNTQPSSCQAGDLAGKHGNITTATFQASYLDLYLSTTPGSPYFFGDKSIVIHSTNVTRLTCANFTMVAASSTTATSTSTATGAVYTGAAAKVVKDFGAIVGGSIAAIAMLF